MALIQIEESVLTNIKLRLDALEAAKAKADDTILKSQQDIDQLKRETGSGRQTVDDVSAAAGSALATGLTAASADAAAQVAAEAVLRAAADATKQADLALVMDYRATTGATNRTETVVSLSVNQTAVIFWLLFSNSGGSASPFLALPAGGTYAISLLVSGVDVGGLLSGTGSISRIFSSVAVAGGSSTVIGINGVSGNGWTITGFVRRIS